MEKEYNKHLHELGGCWQACTAYTRVCAIALHQLSCRYKTLTRFSDTFLKLPGCTTKAGRKCGIRFSGGAKGTNIPCNWKVVNNPSRIWLFYSKTKRCCFLYQPSTVLFLLQGKCSHHRIYRLHDSNWRRSNTEAELTSALWAAGMKSGQTCLINSTSIKM